MARPKTDYLTDTQERILACIRGSIERRGEAPTLAEIGEQVGLRSRASVHYHLQRIERLGHISRDPRRTRAIRLR
ncbi:hypothetical protein [Streptomyces mangrovisoli]|nr:hypothetical protein [Streptomyces mangrovisoli]